MDDFMEKLLQEVSQETNNMGAGQPAAQQNNTQRYSMGNQSQPRGNMYVSNMQATQAMPNMPQYSGMQQNTQGIPQPMPHQNIPRPQPMPQPQMPPHGTPVMQQAPNARGNTAPMNNNMYSQGSMGQGGGRSVSFEDVSYFPDADKQSSRPLPGVEELAMEARKTEVYDERYRNNNQNAQNNAAPPQNAGTIDTDKMMENVQSIVHTEVVKCYKNTEAAINDASKNVTESLEKANSPTKIYKVILGLLILNVILVIILVLHNFLGVI